MTMQKDYYRKMKKIIKFILWYKIIHVGTTCNQGILFMTDDKDSFIDMKIGILLETTCKVVYSCISSTYFL